MSEDDYININNFKDFKKFSCVRHPNNLYNSSEIHKKNFDYNKILSASYLFIRVFM